MMKIGGRGTLFIAVIGLVWLMVMALVGRDARERNKEREQTALNMDVTMGEARKYYNVYKDGVKSGYFVASRINMKNITALREEAVLKVNLSGMSRELSVQSTAGIDSASMQMAYFDFRIQSGAHTFVFNSSMREDSLFINVKMNEESPWRRGAFIVDENILPLVGLPLRIWNSDISEFSFQVFDPFIFAPVEVDVVRGAAEVLSVDGRDSAASRYEVRLGEDHVTVWLDSLGWMVRGEGIKLLGEALGEFEVIESAARDVFLLPIETTLGNETIRSWRFPAEEFIPNPRDVEYMEVELGGIRAATVDTGSSNKETLSLRPVVFGIHNRPAALSAERRKTTLSAVARDTSLVGSSDYIQPRDARMARAARNIVGTQSDTLAMARAINRWVHESMRKEDVGITRSIDVLRILRGGPDEHTKLFTALARSISIPTQINAGLVYEDGVFRYHSWPSIFYRGVWRDLDPWFGQDAADATHIALMRGDFERLDEILRLMGVLSLKVLMYR